jgi:hypothetical protein
MKRTTLSFPWRRTCAIAILALVTGTTTACSNLKSGSTSGGSAESNGSSQPISDAITEDSTTEDPMGRDSTSDADSDLASVEECIADTWRLDEKYFGETMEALAPPGIGTFTSSGERLLQIDPLAVGSDGRASGSFGQTVESTLTAVGASNGASVTYTFDSAIRGRIALSPITAKTTSGGQALPVEDIQLLVGGPTALASIHGITSLRDKTTMDTAMNGKVFQSLDISKNSVTVDLQLPSGNFSLDLENPWPDTDPPVWIGAIACVGDQLWFIAVEGGVTTGSVIFDRASNARIRLG